VCLSCRVGILLAVERSRYSRSWRDSLFSDYVYPRLDYRSSLIAWGNAVVVVSLLMRRRAQCEGDFVLL